jgi:Flp pilus assembly protein TadB
MNAVSILITLLLIAGFFILFGIGPSVFAKITGRLERAEKRRRKIEDITSKPPGAIRRRIMQAEQMLESAGLEEEWPRYRLASVFLAVLGVVIGLALDNVFLALVMVPVMAMLPLIIINFRTVQYIRKMGEGAQTAMTVVTNAYRMNEDFISAVRESLPNLQQPMLGIFRTFLSDVEMIDPNVTDAIRKMRGKVRNRYWQAWCDTLMECQTDRALREVLGTILKRMSMTQRLQMELDTLVRSNYIYFITEVLLVVLVPLLIGFIIPDYTALLFGTVPGKITLAAAIAALFLAALRTIKVNRPLDV